ncbi:MAG TPA: class A beta-lactamase [Thermoanaerobaculia bacterium]
MNFVLPIALLALAAPAPEPSPDTASAAIVRAAEEAEKSTGASIGVSVLHLESGRRIAHQGRERFQMASVFKVPVAIATLDAVEKGALRLDQDVEIRPADRRKIGPLHDEWKPGMRVTVSRMIDVMLVYSDNTAADKLVELMGGPSAVEKALLARGVTGVRVSLDEKGMDAARKKDFAAFERGVQNGTSPDAMTEMLARLFRGELLPRPRTDFILDAMRRCATSDRRLRAGVPKGTEVFDKTGTVGACSNDAGIVTLPDGSHLVLAVFVRGGADAAAREAAIASVARAAWGAFAPERTTSGGTASRARLRAWSSP